MAIEATTALWAGRVRAWRQSGMSAAAFVEGRDYAASTLRMWSSRLRPTAVVATVPAGPRIVPLLRRGGVAPSVAEGRGAELVIEVGLARVRIARGFDPVLLVEVLRALQAGVAQ